MTDQRAVVVLNGVFDHRFVFLLDLISDGDIVLVLGIDLGSEDIEKDIQVVIGGKDRSDVGIDFQHGVGEIAVMHFHPGFRRLHPFDVFHEKDRCGAQAVGEILGIG